MLWTFIFHSVFEYCLLEGYLSLELYTCVQHLPKSLASFLSFERPPKALEENWEEVHQAQFIGAAGMAQRRLSKITHGVSVSSELQTQAFCLQLQCSLHTLLQSGIEVAEWRSQPEAPKMAHPKLSVF